MIQEVGALTVYQSGHNSPSSLSPPISAYKERGYGEEGVVIVSGLKLEERLKAPRLDKRERTKAPQGAIC